MREEKQLGIKLFRTLLHAIEPYLVDKRYIKPTAAAVTALEQIIASIRETPAEDIDSDELKAMRDAAETIRVFWCAQCEDIYQRQFND